MSMVWMIFNRINHVSCFHSEHGCWTWGTYGQSHGGEVAKVATAWFQWQLKNDQEIGKMFTGNPSGLSKKSELEGGSQKFQIISNIPIVSLLWQT